MLSVSVLLTILASLSPASAAPTGPKVLSLGFTKELQTGSVAKRDGSVDLSLTNTPMRYFVNADFGSNAQDIQIAFDTGSSDTWVYASLACDSGNADCATYGSYDASASSSDVDTGKTSSFAYGDGLTTATGKWITDSVAFSGITLSQYQFSVNDGGLLAYGIMGAGKKSLENTNPQYDNIPFALKNQGFIGSAAYLVYLNELDASTGEVLFGGVDSGKYLGSLAEKPFTDVGLVDSLSTNSYNQYSSIHLDSIKVGDTTVDFDGGVIFDTGAPFCVLGEDARSAIALVLGGTDGQSVLCTPSSDPDVVLTFSGTAFTFKASDFIIKIDDSCYAGVAALSSSGGLPLMGDPIIRKLYLVYNLDKETLSLANADYSGKSGTILEI